MDLNTDSFNGRKPAAQSQQARNQHRNQRYDKRDLLCIFLQERRCIAVLITGGAIMKRQRCANRIICPDYCSSKRYTGQQIQTVLKQYAWYYATESKAPTNCSRCKDERRSHLSRIRGHATKVRRYAPPQPTFLPGYGLEAIKHI